MHPPHNCRVFFVAGVRVSALIAAGVMLLAVGWAGAGPARAGPPPIDMEPDRNLRRAAREAAERELAEARRHPEVLRTVRESRLPNLGIAPEVMDELNRMAGPASYLNEKLNLGPTLFGTEQNTAPVTLERAIKTAVNNNLNVEFARLAPAISQQQLIAADAAFDWVLFNNSTWSNTDQPRTTSAQSILNTDERNVFDTSTGVRKPLISGGQVTVQHQYIYTDNSTPGLQVRPNPAQEGNIVLQLDQPLLRNFGSDVALSQVRLAANMERDEIQSLRGTLIDTVTQVEQTYWSLVRARDDLYILQRLQVRGEDVLVILRQRFDAKPVNKARAAAAVEARRADVIRGQRVLRDASDQLKTLINDPEWTVGSEVLLLPVDTTLDQPVEYSLVDSLNVAFANRPEVQRAIISLDNTSIRQRVADSARLPQLNLRALTRFNSLDKTADKSYAQLTEGRFVDYQLGLTFELPVGNRAAEANFRTTQIQRMEAGAALKNTLQGVSGNVKSRLRDTVLNYTLIEQTRVSRIAAAEDLRQVLIEESTTSGLTPEFLDDKLRRQEALAVAEQRENQALTDYATALAQLHQACGTALEHNQIVFEVPKLKRPEVRESDLFPDYPAQRRRE